MKNKEQIIKFCGFSEEMERFLIDYKPNDFEMLDIILGAPLPLTEKRELLELLLKLVTTPESIEYEDVSECIREFDDALAALELKDGEIFTLSECWYDYDILDEKEAFAEPFLSFQAAVDYIEEETKDMEYGEEYEYWTKITKWIPIGEGKMKDAYTYTFVDNEIHYFRRIVNPPRKRFRWHRSSLDLNLPIPFKPGDIVTLNCLPFKPVKRAVLLEVDNQDCCGVQILYQQIDKTNKKPTWSTGALKHGDGWEGFFPMLSSLYRLSKYEGELPENERLMKDVQRYVLKDEKNGRKLWDFMHNSSQSETELSEFLKKNI